MTTGNISKTELGVDPQYFYGASVGSGVLTTEGALSIGVPVFTETSSMNPVAVGKGQEVRPDRWKPNSVDSATTAMQVELSPGFVSPEPIYYVTPEYINGFSLYPEAVSNGDAIQFQQAGITEPSSPMNGDASSPASDKISPEDLKRLIRQQFEYYFSRENLANDAYLVSQMDNDQFVSISTVARFPQIKKLTSDLDLIAESLKDSQHIQLNENGDKVRANTKRCIVILREIPDSTPIQEIKDLFDSENCPKYTNCEFAHNNSWYVTFDSEEDAHKAYRYLREEVKNFHGKPIMARIKAKTLLSRSTLVRPQNSNKTSPGQAETSQPQPAAQPVFSQRQYTTFQVPAAVIAGQQAFPYYPGTIVQTTWIDPRHQFFTPEVIAPTSQFQPNSFVKPLNITGPRQFFAGTKQRIQTKTFFKADNGERLSDKDERGQNNSFRRPMVNNRQGSGNQFGQKDNDLHLRRPPHLRSKREEVVPRFQRLRERERRQMEQNFPPENDVNNLNLDLAPENFPALPSPSSPNEKSQQETSSLKELATNALNKTNVQIEKIEKSDDNSSDVWVCWNSKFGKSHGNTSMENGISTGDKSPTSSSSPPLCITPPLQTQENPQSSSRPSYAQMAQKPKLKTPTAAKATTDVTHNKESRSPNSKTDQSDNKQNKNKNSKNITNKEEKENLRKDAANSNMNGMSPKSQKRTRESRILSDPGTRNVPKPTGVGSRNNSYNGPDSSSVKESYASKSSANSNPGSVKGKPSLQGVAHGQAKTANSKNNTGEQGHNNKSDKPAKENSNIAANKNIASGIDMQVKVEKNNNDNKEQGNSAEEN